MPEETSVSKCLENTGKDERPSIRQRLINALRGDTDSIRYRFYRYPVERLKDTYRRLRGVSWNEYYAERLDGFNQERTTDKVKPHYLANGRIHLDYLTRYGMKSHHSLFDFGCGLGRSAIYFIEYLEQNKYVGSDLSEQKLRIAHEFIEQRALKDKNPEFLCNKDNSLNWLNGRQFDYIWSHSVLNHMPDEDVRDLFKNLPRIMHRESIGLMTIIENRTKASIRRTIKDWSRLFSWYQEVAEKCSMNCELLHDWGKEPIRFNDQKRVIRLTLK